MDPPQPSLPKPDVEASLRKALENALSQRKINYKLVFVATVTFESDDTGAREDSKAFAAAMKQAFKMPAVNVLEFVVPKEEYHSPIYWYREVEKKIGEVSKSSQGRKLLLFHFAGHGGFDSYGSFCLEGGPPTPGLSTETQKIQWGDIKGCLLSSQGPMRSDVTDVAIILDCCFSGAIETDRTRYQAPTGHQKDPTNVKIVEVLSATDNRTTTAGRDLGRQATFTRRFIQEIRTMIGRSDSPLVTFPAVLAALNKESQSPKPLATYHFLSGTAPILFPVTSLEVAADPTPGPSNPRAMDTWRRPEHNVALKVHFPFSADDESISTVVKWLYKLRRDFEIEVIGVNKTASTVVFLTVPYENLYLLYGLEDSRLCTVERVCENIYSKNLLHDILGSPFDPVAVPSTG
ncbi:hypothetical protein TWF730_009739 [Orbilia blumenaviensis]|uniref:Peptidase C14 caspase domain-containing protein n=1 Tax=Orbilia blumenaviensis TaxID=1796055 RepID=A0AAV9UV61_9PEZI